jgi:hypothetical protein
VTRQNAPSLSSAFLFVLLLALPLAASAAKRGGDDPGGGGGSNSIGFDEHDYPALEGAGQAVITVERHGEHGAASVQYATEDGTAIAGTHYTAVHGTLAWADGDESTKTFLVPILNDGVAGSSKTARLVLSNPTGATLDGEHTTAQLNIQDSGDDNGGGSGSGEPGVIRFDEPSFQAVEGEMATIRVERSHGEHGAVSVHFATSDGSAIEGADYNAASGTLSWANGQEGSKTFKVTTLSNTAGSGNKIVNLTLSQPSGGATLDPARTTASLVILDKNGDTSACVASDSTLCLAGGRFRIEVKWRTGQGTTGSGHPVRINDNSGTFWFFSADNSEMLIKVLDACAFSGQYWVFYAATTNVGFTVEVTDTKGGLMKEYSSPLGLAAQPVNDTFSFKTCN